MEDWTSYNVTIEPAVAGTYRNRHVYTTQAPTSGPIVLHILNLLENYDLPGEGRTALNIHRLIEAMKCKSILSLNSN
jgi:gamma-glutamyltranspeptidase/glutathione hydrolase/leukotriene-C4 hydrolase